MGHDQLDVAEGLGAVSRLLVNNHHGGRLADQAVEVEADGLLGGKGSAVPVLEELGQAGLLMQAWRHWGRHDYPGLHRVACLVDQIQLERDLELL